MIANHPKCCGSREAINAQLYNNDFEETLQFVRGEVKGFVFL